MFDFVQEMGDLKLALYGAGIITHYISLLVLICDAKTWSPPHQKKNETVSAPGLSYALIGCLTLYKRWET